MMGVVSAAIQTVEEVYRLVWTSVDRKEPIEASYEGRHRRLCPHRLGRNSKGELRVLCYQYGGESRSKLQQSDCSANWRCMVVEKLRHVRVLEGERRTAPNHSRPASCVVDADIDAEDHADRDPQNGQ
jgi:hypothetical protein